jgi:hypothetical protein
MDTLPHSIRKQTITVRCDSQDCAFELRPRISDFNRSHFLPIIERVLSEAGVPGRLIRIERLEVDLGEISLGEFEEVAAARLYRELKDAVEAALGSQSKAAEQAGELSRLELLEWYLLRGTLPYWAASLPAFSAAAWFAEFSQSEPAALAKAVRRVGVHDHALERIVCQLSEGELRRLVALLDPEHASLILAYMADLVEVQREEPVAAIDDAEFDSLLWLLVLSYLTREAGTQFNRKMFVESLIRGFAARQGLEYEYILTLLGASLERIEERHGMPSSLPAVIAELVHESARHFADTGEEEAAERDDIAAAMTEPAALAALVRRHGTDAAWLERLVAALDADTLIALIRILEPQQAATILAFVFDVRDVHRAEPFVAGELAQFDRLLWVVTLSWIVQERGSEFNRKTFLRAVVQRVARNEKLEFSGVVAMFRLGLARLATRGPVRSSLPGVLAGLIDDIDREAPLPSSPPDAAPTLALLAGAFAHDLPSHRLQLVLCAVGAMPVEGIHRFTLHILPLLGRPETPAAQAFHLALKQARQPRVFYAKLILAIARGEDLDFSEIAQACEKVSDADQAAFAPETWDAGMIKAAILLRAASASTGSGTAISRLSEQLMRLDPGGARSFLAGIGVPGQSGNPTHFSGLPGDMTGPNSEAVRLLFAVMETLPTADRPPLDKLREMLTLECPQGEPSRVPDREILARILAAAFPVPLPGRIRSALLASVPEEATALRAALGAHIISSSSNRATELEAAARPLFAAIETLPATDRPPLDKLREILFQESLRCDSNRRTDRGFFARILAAAFSVPLPGPIRSALLASVPEEATALRAALGAHSISSSSNGTSELEAARPLFAAIETLPATDRPPLEKLREILFQESLRGDGDRRADRDFFARILAAAFPVPLPGRIRAALLEATPEGATALHAALVAHGNPVTSNEAARTVEQRSIEELLSLLAHAEEASPWIAELEAALHESSEALPAAAVKRLADPAIRARVPGILPDSTWTALVRYLEPARHRSLLLAADVFVEAWVFALPGTRRSSAAELVRGAVLELLIEGAASVETLTVRLLARFRRGAGVAPQDRIKFQRHAAALADQRGMAELRTALQATRVTAKPTPAYNLPRPEARQPKMLPEDNDAIYIGNAGLVLAAPFLPHLFESLGMLEKDPKGRSGWRNPHTASRAVHLLQYLVDGRTQAPEHLLTLNKILCGLPTAVPIEMAIEPSAQELEMCDKLLDAMLANWSLLANSSVDALRETFFQREGRLNRDGGKWNLLVQRKTLDVLVDQAPWSFRVILHSWMPDALHVTW